MGEGSINQDVYFVQSVKMSVLSLMTCKELQLVPHDFPHPSSLLAHVSLRDDIISSQSASPTKPITLPFLLREENFVPLEGWLVRHFSSTSFNTPQPLPVITGTPPHIHPAANAVPFACHTPTSVPKHWEEEVRAQIDENVRRHVLTGKATEYRARMMVLTKKSGQPLRTVDFQRLKAACICETNHTPLPLLTWCPECPSMPSRRWLTHIVVSTRWG